MTLDGLLESLFTLGRGDGRAQALPTLDGPLKANQRLDEARVWIDGLAEVDDLVAHPAGGFVCSAGTRLLHLDSVNDTAPRLLCECAGPIGPVAVSGEAIYAGVGGVGVLRIVDGRVNATLAEVDGQPLHCPTAFAVLPDGRLAIAEGSTVNGPQAWARDLLERRVHGRVVIAAADLANPRTRLSGLAWPAGLLVRDTMLWVSESWRHRVQALDIEGSGAAQPLLPDLPGYPGRLAAAADGGAWLAVFALRTHLVEFVLRERAYREDMLATVDPQWWIAPSLRSTGHYLEPLQGGAIKKLGQIKPWAPPRSYGLALRLSAGGQPMESLHSRVGGLHHGITAVLPQVGQLLLVSKGSERLIVANLERTA